jgi:GLPGLI family protein
MYSTPEGRKQWARLFKAGASTNNFPYHRTSEYIYVNYPKKEKITVTDNVSLDRFTYEEKYESQKWEILDETKQILEYDCQKAQCRYRGRIWFAWFTNDIAIDAGPYKFSGLPGLIMELHDEKNHYNYEIIGLQQMQDKPLYFYNFGKVQFSKTTREKFNKLQRNFLINSFGYIKATTGIDLNMNGTPNEVHEMKYGFIELDME